MFIGRGVFVSSVIIAVSSLGPVGANWETAAQEAAADQGVVSAQIREGMNLAAAAKVRIAETYLARGSAPQNREGAGLTADPADTQGRYVASIDIVQGEIIIAYRSDAHPSIAGKVLILTPILTADGIVVWQCGYSTSIADGRGIPMGANTSNDFTTIDAQYLDPACRSRFR